MFDAIKTDNSFTSIPTINAELTGKLLRRLHLDPLLLLLKKGVFNKNIIRTSQVVVACSLNEKSTEVSSSNEDSAEKSDEEDYPERISRGENPRDSGGCSRVGKGRRSRGYQTNHLLIYHVYISYFCCCYL